MMITFVLLKEPSGCSTEKRCKGKDCRRDWKVALVSHSQERNWNQNNKIRNG